MNVLFLFNLDIHLYRLYLFCCAKIQDWQWNSTYVCSFSVSYILTFSFPVFLFWYGESHRLTEVGLHSTLILHIIGTLTLVKHVAFFPSQSCTLSTPFWIYFVVEGRVVLVKTQVFDNHYTKFILYYKEYLYLQNLSLHSN